VHRDKKVQLYFFGSLISFQPIVINMFQTELIDISFVLNCLMAIGMGGLIGLEREHRLKEKEVIAGVRTFPLTALSGVIFSFLAANAGLVILEVGLAIFGGFALILTFLKLGVRSIGVTTQIAFYMTFLIGVMIERNYALEAVFVTVLVTSLLLTKNRLHKLAKDIGE